MRTPTWLNLKIFIQILINFFYFLSIKQNLRIDIMMMMMVKKVGMGRDKIDFLDFSSRPRLNSGD